MTLTSSAASSKFVPSGNFIPGGSAGGGLLVGGWTMKNETILLFQVQNLGPPISDRIHTLSTFR